MFCILGSNVLYKTKGPGENEEPGAGRLPERRLRRLPWAAPPVEAEFQTPEAGLSGF